MNIYGLFAINNRTLNVECDQNIFQTVYTQKQRNTWLTMLKVNNLVFGILGYIPNPYVSMVSGSIRMIIGAMMYFDDLSQIVKSEEARTWKIWSDLNKEWHRTGLVQIVRGALEAFVPYGKYVNASLDICATVYNLQNYKSEKSNCKDQQKHGCTPYPQPHYEGWRKILNAF